MTAVVFDVDGVLVDSEPHSRAAWVTVLGRHGRLIDDDDVLACTGLGFWATYDRLVGSAGSMVPDPDSLWPELLEALGESFQRGLARFDDAVESLERLAFAGVPIALAIASPRSRLDLTLQVSGVGRYAQASVAGDEVDHPKPAPDVYLAAARLLGVDPHRCVAVEDSATGAASAVAADMRVFGVARHADDAGALMAAGAAVSTAVDFELLATWIG